MTDIHAHILPGLDDGAESMDEALFMAEMAVQSGVEKMIVTPHSHQIGRFENYYTDDLRRAFHNFQEALWKNRIPLKIYPGMEIFAGENLRDKILQRQVIGLNFSNYYLTEFAFQDRAERMESVLRGMLGMGINPIIAHPERYTCVQQRPELVLRWMEMGCLSQVNKGSLLGRFGKRVRHTAVELLNHYLVTFIASDAHGSEYRTPEMEEIRDFLELYYGMEAALALLQRNAEKYLNVGTQ